MAVGLIAAVVLALSAGLAAGLAAGLLASRQARRGSDALLAELRARLEAAEARASAEGQKVVSLSSELAAARAALAAERQAGQARTAELERAREQLRAELQLVAGRLVDEKGGALLARSQEALSHLLAPVADKLRAFEAKVEKAYDQENRDRASLLQSLALLRDAQGRLHQDAERLARALTGESKAQGDWGELVLERVLEVAGLTEGREFELQVTHDDGAGGRKRPDALVYLPGDRAVVVDAKCSLTAFVEAQREGEAAAREAALDRHVASLRAHVKGLAGKRYPEVLRHRTLDVVMLFVPSEPAFQSALSRDAALYEDAIALGVVIVSPTTLLAALQVVRHVWRTEQQGQNARRIADEAGKLLEKLGAFLADLDGVGTRLAQAQESFQSARAKLATGRGNVLKKAADLARLGAPVRGEKAQALVLEGAEEEDAPAPPETQDHAPALPAAREPGPRA